LNQRQLRHAPWLGLRGHVKRPVAHPAEVGAALVRGLVPVRPNAKGLEARHLLDDVGLGHVHGVVVEGCTRARGAPEAQVVALFNPIPTFLDLVKNKHHVQVARRVRLTSDFVATAEHLRASTKKDQYKYTFQNTPLHGPKIKLKLLRLEHLPWQKQSRPG